MHPKLVSAAIALLLGFAAFPGAERLNVLQSVCCYLLYMPWFLMYSRTAGVKRIRSVGTSGRRSIAVADVVIANHQRGLGDGVLGRVCDNASPWLSAGARLKGRGSPTRVFVVN